MLSFNISWYISVSQPFNLLQAVSNSKYLSGSQWYCIQRLIVLQRLIGFHRLKIIQWLVVVQYFGVSQRLVKRLHRTEIFHFVFIENLTVFKRLIISFNVSQAFSASKASSGSSRYCILASHNFPSASQCFTSNSNFQSCYLLASLVQSHSHLTFHRLSAPRKLLVARSGIVFQRLIVFMCLVMP